MVGMENAQSIAARHTRTVNNVARLNNPYASVWNKNKVIAVAESSKSVNASKWKWRNVLVRSQLPVTPAKIVNKRVLPRKCTRKQVKDLT